MTSTPFLPAAPSSSRTTITVSPALRRTPASCFAVEFVGRVSSTRCHWPCTRTCTRARPGARFANVSSVEVMTWRHICCASTSVNTRSVCSMPSRIFESDDDPPLSSLWVFLSSNDLLERFLRDDFARSRLSHGTSHCWRKRFLVADFRRSLETSYSLAEDLHVRWCKCLMKVA